MLPNLSECKISKSKNDKIRLKNQPTTSFVAIDMKRASITSPDIPTRPVGVDDDTWRAYVAAILASNSLNVPKPRTAYAMWTERDFESCRRKNPLHETPGAMPRLVPYTNPPNSGMFETGSETLWMLNVKPPWASALVAGVKNVENRTIFFPEARWTLIISSGKQTKTYAQTAEKDLNTRLRQSGQTSWIGHVPTAEYQKIVGLVKLRCYTFEDFVYTAKRCSVWYNGKYVDDDGNVIAWDNALFVEEAFTFAEPIPYTDGKLSMTRFATVTDANLVATVANAIRNLTKVPTLPRPQPAAGPSNPYPGVMDSDDDMDVSDTTATAQPLSRPLPTLPSISATKPSIHSFYNINSFNDWGCMTWKLEAIEGIETFLQQLNQGAQEWFSNNLSRALVEPPRRPDFQSGHDIWQSTPADIRQEILNAFDLRTHDGIIRASDAQVRKESIPEPVRQYLDDRLQYAKAGMNATAQGNSAVSWLKNGFGIWAKILSSMGMKVMMPCKNVFENLGYTTYVTGAPHIIYKPPRGDKLSAHHDRIPTMALITKLREHVASADPSNEAWALKHGIQMLAHVKGGYRDGYTYTVGPMTCETLLWCMELLLQNPPDIATAAWSTSKTAVNKYESFMNEKSKGPYFCDWYKLVGKDGNGPLNKRLIAAQKAPLKIVPIVPFEKTTESPYIAWWPSGFPHGSLANQEPRVSFTMEMQLGVPATPPSQRWVARLRNLAILAHTGSTPAEVEAAEAAIQADTEPYHGGGTHLKPEMIADLQRNAEYAHGGKAVGPFASIAPTRDEVEEFLSAVL
jgi:hypothetical protein